MQAFFVQPVGEGADALYRLVSAAISRAGTGIGAINTIQVGSGAEFAVREQVHIASIVIADVTGADPSVMFAVGTADALSKPTLLVAAGSRHVPFALAGVPVVIYDLAEPGDFVERLQLAIEKANRIAASADTTASGLMREDRPRVFISYSHADSEYLDRLLVHLKPLEREGLLNLWVDTRLRAGDRWKEEIEKALGEATVAVLLLSADFLASDFIVSNELPPILRSAEAEGTRVIPFVLKPCRFSRDSSLKRFQSLNDPLEPLIGLAPGEQEYWYDALAQEIEAVLPGA